MLLFFYRSKCIEQKTKVAAKTNAKCLGLEDKGFQECMDAVFPSQKKSKVCVR